MQDEQQPESPRTIYLIDGSSFIFRAFFALPPVQREDGVQVNAVYGFCNMLWRIINEFHATHVTVLFDAGRKTFRNDIYPEYKAHRPPLPRDLGGQFPLIREATRAFGIMGIEMEGFEADDLIASYAKLAAQAGYIVHIVSPDKDLTQLISEKIFVFDPIKNALLTEFDVMEKFGVMPSKVVDVLALAGDTADNVPGVPGIGMKTAAELVTRFGSLLAVLDHADEISQPRRREALKANREQALLSGRLVQLDMDVPLPFPFGCLRWAGPDRARLRVFLEDMGFFSLVEKMGV